MIETWGFLEDIKGTKGMDLLRMMRRRTTTRWRTTMRRRTTTRTTTTSRTSQLWDLIETWGFRKDIKGTGPDSVDLADWVLNLVSQLLKLIKT